MSIFIKEGEGMAKKETDEQKKRKLLLAYLAKNKMLCGIPDDKTLALRLHMHPSTLCRKLKSANGFTESELRRMFKVLCFSDEEKAAVM